MITVDYLSINWKILVIDDSKLNRAIIRKTLSDLNMLVDEAQDGEQGLEALGKKQYDLVLVDIVMPNLDGFGFLARFKDTVGNNFVPVILMTGSDDLNSKIKGLRIGADDFLLKPLNEKELVARVLSLLRLKSVYAELYEKNMQIKKEMSMAKKIQEYIIPKNFSHIKYPRISSRYLPIEDIGGDFFDCYKLSDDRIGFVIADVAGHGIPAALVMSMSKMLFSIYSTRSDSPKDIFSMVNSDMMGLLLDSQYITSFYVVYDNIDKRLKYANAGHTRPLYYRRHNKKVFALDTKGYFIGISSTTAYEEKTIEVEKGDRLILYTDGITEIKNSEYEEYGENRLAQFMVSNHSLEHEEFSKTMMEEVLAFSKAESRIDDMAFLSIEF